MEAEIANMRKKEKKAKKKMRGRSKIGNKMASTTRQQHEAIRESNKLSFLKEVERAKAEKQVIDGDLEFLSKHESKFDPVDSMFTKEGQLKRQKRE